MIQLQENTFAAACYNRYTTQQLEDALRGPAFITDCKIWGITAHAWRYQIKLALRAKWRANQD